MWWDVASAFGTSFSSSSRYARQSRLAVHHGGADEARAGDAEGVVGGGVAPRADGMDFRTIDAFVTLSSRDEL